MKKQKTKSVKLIDLYLAMYKVACGAQCGPGACCADFWMDTLLEGGHPKKGEIHKLIKRDFNRGKREGSYPCHLRWFRDLGNFYEEAANIKMVLEALPDDVKYIILYTCHEGRVSISTSDPEWLRTLILALPDVFYIHCYSGEEEKETHIINVRSSWSVVDLDAEQLTSIAIVSKYIKEGWVPESHKKQLREAYEELKRSEASAFLFSLFHDPLTDIWTPVRSEELTDIECLELTAAYINICGLR